MIVEGGQGCGNNGDQVRGRAFMMGAWEAHQDPNRVTGTFTLDNHYATTLFDYGADYSFVSTTFMPLSFDVIVEMDWFSGTRPGLFAMRRHVINGDGLHVDSSKIEAVTNWKPLELHQWIRLELFSDYDCEIHYHPRKANVVADALSQKERFKPNKIRGMNMTIQSSIKDKILVAQNESYRIWVPLTGNVRTLIMDEAHKSKYSVHRGTDKMYYDLRDMYWWSGMKKDIALYADFLPIREDYKIDMLARLYLNEIIARHGVPISIIFDLCLRKGADRFGKKGKLAPRYVGPFEITERIGLVAYRLRLPQELNGVHDMFHVSNLKKCLADPTLQIPLDDIQVDAKLNFIEELVEILEREFKKLKRSRIAIVKVRWNLK
ncbi:putative reverse transcriptase domain-containing protein [Tanacetum coccineum]|uniref:Reverse transcriptase domain-containing protein n=1 Tax=Tanacetum coccineum TaxID=301880 RepID=A0ABQ4Z9J7_9ASTR